MNTERIDQQRSKQGRSFLWGLGLASLFVCIGVAFWGRFGDLFRDCGFEYFLPLRLSQGATYFRDYPVLIPPLSYQLNTLFLWVFGKGISTLYLAGFINSLIFLIFFFLVLEKISTCTLAGICTFSVMLTTVYSPDIFNFIFPYTFAQPYSVTAVYVSLYFLLRCLESNRSSNFYIACFSFGMALGFKHEFIFFAIAIFYVALLRKISMASICIGIGLCASPILASVVALYIEGFTWSDSTAMYSWVRKFVSSPILSTFYASAGVYSPTMWITLESLYSCFAILLAVGALIFCNRIVKTPQIVVYLRMTLLAGFSVVPWEPFSSFQWLPPFCLILSVHASTRMRSYQSFDERLFVVIIGCTLAQLKVLGASPFWGYGTSFFPFVVTSIAAVATMMNNEGRLGSMKLPSCSNILIGSIFLAISLGLFVKVSLPAFSDKYYSISEENSSSFNVIKVSGQFRRELEPQLKELKRRATVNSTLWVVPEGTGLNALLGISAFGEFHNLSPVFFHTYTEDFIIEKLLAKKPHFVLINTLPRLEYGKFARIGIDYGEKLWREVESRYCPIIAGSENSPFVALSSNPADCR